MVVSEKTLIYVGIAIITVVLAIVNRFGRRHGIAEARFDSETGKQISDE
jgi:hypothetical protein